MIISCQSSSNKTIADLKKKKRKVKRNDDVGC